MNSPMIGKEDYVKFLTMSFYLSFIHFLPYNKQRENRCLNISLIERFATCACGDR